MPIVRKLTSREDHLHWDGDGSVELPISAEPLLGSLNNVDLTEIHWLIAGGESGHRHRFCNPDWLRELRDRCQAAQIAFFFKQWGGRTPKAGGRHLDGRTWDEMPALPGPKQSTLFGEGGTISTVSDFD